MRGEGGRAAPSCPRGGSGLRAAGGAAGTGGGQRGDGGCAGPLPEGKGGQTLPRLAGRLRWKLPGRAGQPGANCGSVPFPRARAPCAFRNTSAATFMNFLSALRQVTSPNRAEGVSTALPWSSRNIPINPSMIYQLHRKRSLWVRKTPEVAKSGISQKAAVLP